MSESFGARARKFMGWYSPEEPIDEFEEFDEVEEVAPVADITPVSRPTLTSIRREEPAEDLTRIVTIHPTAYSDAVTIGEAFRNMPYELGSLPAPLDIPEEKYQD